MTDTDLHSKLKALVGEPTGGTESLRWHRIRSTSR